MSNTELYNGIMIYFENGILKANFYNLFFKKGHALQLEHYTGDAIALSMDVTYVPEYTFNFNDLSIGDVEEIIDWVNRDKVHDGDAIQAMIKKARNDNVT